MTGQKVTENGNDSALRWGIAVKSVVSDLYGVQVYGSEDEARDSLTLATMDVPARLVMDDGNGWAAVE